MSVIPFMLTEAYSECPVVDLANGVEIPIETARRIVDRAKNGMIPCVIKIPIGETSFAFGAATGWHFDCSNESGLTVFAVYGENIMQGTITLDENAGTATCNLA